MATHRLPDRTPGDHLPEYVKFGPNAELLTEETLRYLLRAMRVIPEIQPERFDWWAEQ
ncbi:hypothetical protein [Nocardia alni]|uniref:hypothetical protein n=1 Tax=Nocardia alni TaxID=2815723 RepID=UPI001C24C4D8|nr:hypothetical protein [Nocardia alni]